MSIDYDWRWSRRGGLTDVINLVSEKFAKLNELSVGCSFGGSSISLTACQSSRGLRLQESTVVSQNAANFGRADAAS